MGSEDSPEVMKIALDYDGTYTLNPNFWDVFIGMCFVRGIDIRIVTLRSEEEDGVSHDIAIPIIYCDGQSKRSVTRDLGFFPDIWIDDKPETIPNGSDFTPEELAEWRANGRVHTKS